MTLGRTFTHYETEQRDSLGGLLFRNVSDEGENSLRAELRFTAGPRVDVTVGDIAIHGSRMRYDLGLVGYLRTDSLGVPQPLLTDTSFTTFRNGLYTQAVWRAAERVRLTGGLRLDYYAAVGDVVRLSPRLAAAVDLDARTAVQAAVGRYVQGPSSIWLAGDPTNAASLRPFVADQAVLSLERRLRPDLKVQVEGYAKRMRDYPARVFRPQAVLQPSGFEDVQTDIPFGLEPLSSVAFGQSYGLEVFAQKRYSEVPLYGLLSLSASRTELRGLDGVLRPGAFDARFIGTVAAGYRIGRRWELSGKFRAATGLPTTPFITTGPNAGQLDFTQYNAGPRLPTFHQLDLRVDRRWPFRSWQLVLYLDVQNVYGRENVAGYQWDQRTQTAEANTSLGVLPSIGLNIEF
jgi:outer membrane receptor protein involved in Fe transport